jgi:hypothetical protein
MPALKPTEAMYSAVRCQRSAEDRCGPLLEGGSLSERANRDDVERVRRYSNGSGVGM